MNIEIMRNTLYKAYLDDFAAFCNKLGGTTAEVMGSLLSFEVREQFPKSTTPSCFRNERHGYCVGLHGIHSPMQPCCACRQVPMPANSGLKCCYVMLMTSAGALLLTWHR